jgi:hypothetical protein
MDLDTKIIFMTIAASITIISIVIGYFIIQVSNDLNVLLEDSKAGLTFEKQQQTRENIKNTSEIEIENFQEGNNDMPSSSQLSSLSSTTEPRQEEVTIFPFNFIESALIPSPSLVISVIFRTMIIATLVFVIVKWLGGKGLGQLSPFGLIIIIGLGSAVGDPMIYKDISIPQAMAAVIVVVIFFKMIDYITLKSKRFRYSVEPKSIMLVEYGSMIQENLKKARMDKEDFEMQMRLKGIEDVSKIKKAQLESNGQISFIMKEDLINN